MGVVDMIKDMMEDRQSVLSLIWLGIQLCLFAFVISAFVAAGKTAMPCLQGKQTTTDHGAAFVLVWQSMLAIILSVGGTVVLKKNRTETSVGALIAATFMLSNWMLCTAVLAGSQSSAKSILAKTCGESISVAADDAVATFAVFLWMLYGAFGGLLLISRRQILGNEIDEPLMGMDGGGDSHTIGSFPANDPLV